ncbi:MAG: hypothetical protein R3F17_16670 [Planctomycetota bacterium]
MSETKPPTPDKGNRSKPFGPFLLFLLVLVVLLIAFGGSQSQKAQELSQDEFLWKLNRGQVESLQTLDRGEVRGRLANSGTPFRTSFQTLEGREEEIRQLFAAPPPIPVQPEWLFSVLDRGGDPLFTPREVVHLTGILRTKPEDAAKSGQAGATSRPGGETGANAFSQDDRVIVTGTAAPLAAWGAIADDKLNRSRYAMGGLVRFEVQAQGAGDAQGSLARLEKRLGDMGATSSVRTFDITNDGGVNYSTTDSTMTTLLMVWGPWLLIPFVFLLFMRQMRSQGGGGGG